jgi:hypothetical protein
MDYTSNPLGPPSNEHPNAHDYEQIEIIYEHLDSTTTIGMTSATGRGASEWGQAIRWDGRGQPSLFVRDLGRGRLMFTWVFWAI